MFAVLKPRFELRVRYYSGVAALTRSISLVCSGYSATLLPSLGSFRASASCPKNKQIPALDRPSERLGSSINDDIVYEVRTTEVFKGEDEPEVEYNVSMTFDLATGGNSALCGIRAWRSVSPDDQALLREGCEGYDPCDGACGKYQVFLCGESRREMSR